MAASDPVFVLGVGAQKAGTTWLYGYLKRHPACALGEEKELGHYHVRFREEAFDDARTARLQRLIAMAKRQIAAAEAGNPMENADKFLALMDSVAMQYDAGRYGEYFARLRQRNPQARLFGDITPAYSGLTAENFGQIRSEIIAAGFRPRVVFLMRDPVDRCYSAMRMADRNKKVAGGKLWKSARDRFATEAISHWCEIRTRYEWTVPALESAFAPSELHFDFFEDLFHEGAIRAICDHLEIDYRPAKFDAKSNASPSDEDARPEDVATVAAFYAETYRFCRDRFGADRINALWPTARLAENAG